MGIRLKQDENGNRDPVTAPIREFVPAVNSRFPWIPCGNSVIVRMLPRTTRETKGGIIAFSGGDKGIVIGLGPGELIPGSGWINPSKHYGLALDDIVLVNRELGEPFSVDGEEYLKLRPEDVFGRLKRGAALRLVKELESEKAKAMATHEEAGEFAGDATTVSQAAEIPERDFASEADEMVEGRLEAKGEATKTQVLIQKNPVTGEKD